MQTPDSASAPLTAAWARSTIQKGSKSFHWASLILPQHAQRGAHYLYSWCRYCDDVIDDAPSPDESQRRLVKLQEWTHQVFQNLDDPPSLAALPAPFRAFAEVAREFHIPKKYALDLLEGMRMDSQGFEYQSLTDLLRYCYCVAGTVGLMMSHIIGLRSPSALDQAVAMGQAMQLTNIVRDIQEDLARGRIYLPHQWLPPDWISSGWVSRGQVNREGLMASEQREQLYRVALRALDVADLYYQRGREGLVALPGLSALAVSSASRIYQAIGFQIRERGPHALDSRSVVGPLKKLWLTFCAAVDHARSLPYRLRNPWKAAKIGRIWSFYE